MLAMPPPRWSLFNALQETASRLYPVVRQVLQAQEYWRLKGLNADVVILNEHPIGYLDEMHEALVALLDSGPWGAWKGKPGGAFLAKTFQSGADADLLAQLKRDFATVRHVKPAASRHPSRYAGPAGAQYPSHRLSRCDRGCPYGIR